MNKIATNTVFMLIAIITFVMLGDLFFLSNINIQINKTKADLDSKNNKLEKLKKSLSNIATDSQKLKENTILDLGAEGQLMKLIIDENLQTHFKICSYDLYSSYYYKPETENNIIEKPEKKPETTTENKTDNETNNINSPENIPDLDENGMPLNAATESDDNWQGLNIIPVKITFQTNQRDINTVLEHFQQTLPVNAVRSADLIFDDNKISGTYVFTFPLNEYDN